MRRYNDELARIKQIRFAINDNFSCAINHLDKRVERRSLFSQCFTGVCLIDFSSNGS
jgi:hypothetical protein